VANAKDSSTIQNLRENGKKKKSGFSVVKGWFKEFF